MAEVRVEEVKRLRGSSDDADKARDDAVLALAAARMEVKRLDLLQRASREIAGLDRLLEKRASLGRLPDLSARGLADARETMRLLRAARDAHATCEAEMVAAGEALSSIEVEARVQEAGASIEAMDERRAVVTEGLADLPKRLEELGALRGDLDRIAAALGIDGPDAVRSRSPSGPTLARAEALVGRMGAAEREGAEIAEQGRRNDEAQERIETEIARVGPALDPRDLRERIDGLDGCEDRTAAAKQARRVADNEAKRLDSIAGRTALGAADPAGLLALSLPAVTVARKRHDAVGRSKAALHSISGKVRQLTAELGRAEARVAALQAPGLAALFTN